jgi:hypothetical protein
MHINALLVNSLSDSFPNSSATLKNRTWVDEPPTARGCGSTIGCGDGFDTPKKWSREWLNHPHTLQGWFGRSQLLTLQFHIEKMSSSHKVCGF